MAESSWYYTHSGHRMGPVPLTELQSLVASTRVQGQELAWTAGMGDWARVVDLPILRDPNFKRVVTPAPTVETAISDLPSDNGNALQPAPQNGESHELPAPPYVVPRTSLYGPVLLPPRPAATLVQHAEPRGDATEWPLDDVRLLQLEVTGNLRRQVVAAASLYFMLTILTAICGVALLAVSVCLFVLWKSRNNPAPGYLLFAGIMLVFTVILFFASRFTTRSNRAAPAAMMVFFGIVAIMNIAGTIGLLRQSPLDAVYCGIGAAFSIVFAVVSFRGVLAIPEFREQPAWCQEMLVRSKL